MKRKLSVMMLAMCIAASGFSFAFAEGDTYQNLDRRYLGDYSISSEINDDVFNPGEFTVDFALNSAKWLGLENANTSSVVTFKTGADIVKLSEKLPNLTTFVKAQTLAKASIVGNTFDCSNTPSITWDDEGGKVKWQTTINAPKDKIAAALAELKTYLKVTNPGLREADDTDFYSFFDNMMIIKAGSSLQYGKTVLTFTEDCEIDELYDAKCQADYYKSTFAENINRIKEKTVISSADEDAVRFDIATGSFLQFAERKFEVTSPVSISITGADIGTADPLTSVNDALETARDTGEAYEDTKVYSSGKIEHHTGNAHNSDFDFMNDVHADKMYSIHECDVNKVFDSGFGFLNELLGVFAQKDARVVIVSDGTDEEAIPAELDENAAESAVLRITSVESCTHQNIVLKDDLKATVTTIGYTGDKYCADCGILLEEGENIPKLPSSIKLNYTSIKLKTKQSTSAVKVTFVKGDGIKSITSSNTGIVKAAKSGSNVVKLTAGSKTGKATVTVKLKGGKSAKVTVTVQKSAVACTGIKVTSGTSVTIKKGKTHQIKATRSPVTCVQKITYKTSNKKVATVSSSGKIKAKKKGKAKITVKCGKKSKVIKVKVK